MIQKNRMSTDSKLEKVFYILFIFGLLFIWSINQPFNSCPDESMRYVIPNYIFSHGKLPTAFDKSIIDPNYGFSYASQPQLPYIISAVFMKIFSLFSDNQFGMVMAARMTSILAGTAYAYVVIKIGEIIFDKKPLRILFVCLCTLWPEAMFIFTYVNCDGLAMLSVSMIIYTWINAYKNGWNIKNSVLLAIGISVALLSYLNTYIFVLLSFVVYIVYYVFVDRTEGKWKKFFGYGFLILGIVILLAGWHFIRNIVLYNSLFAMNVNNNSNIVAAEGFSASERAANARSMLSTFRGNLSWIHSSLFSYIAVFGWMSIYSYNIHIVYVIIFVFAFIGFICSLKNVKKLSHWSKGRFAFMILLVISIIMPFVMSYIYSYSDYQPQGRYAITSLIPLCFFITKFIGALYDSIPKRFANILIAVNVALIVFATGYSEILIMVSY